LSALRPFGHRRSTARRSSSPSPSRRRARGQGLVEFALVFPIFLLVLVALFDLGRAVFAFNTLTNAAREGARLAIVNQDSNRIIARAKSQTAIVELNDPSVSISFRQATPNVDPLTNAVCSPAAVGCVAVVQFQATYTPITPIIGNILFKGGATFNAKAVLTVEYSCPSSTVAAADCPKQP
jgi:Flp pilus assembly protein TadG